MLRLFTRLAPAASVASALALAGCGGSQRTVATSPARQLQATMSAYYASLARHDAAAACAQITPGFWEATLRDGSAALTAAGGQPSCRGTCVRVLRYVFSVSPTRGSRLAKLRITVRDVSVHGPTALAIVSDGRSAQESRFVRTSTGRWLLDCCTRTQAGTLPRSIYRVPSVSMEPTLKPGQLVAADNTALRTRPPNLGEIVTLHPPSGAHCSSAKQGQGFPQPCGAPAQSTSAEIVIKRVVGLPGDRIALGGGHVVRNGGIEHEPYIRSCTRGGAEPCDFPRGIVVPPGTYYVLGDNRGNTLDSRFYGPIPRGWILGVIAP